MCQRFSVEITSGISNNQLNFVWMMSCLTERLEGSELDQVGYWSEVRI